MTERIPSSSITIAPEITRVTASLSKSDSTNTYLNQNRAEPGDTITLTIEADEPLDYLVDGCVDVRLSSIDLFVAEEGRG